MKLRILFLFLTISSFRMLNAQTDTFIVKGTPTVVTVTPERSYLYLREDNVMKIRYKGKHKLGTVEFKGGTVTQRDSFYIIKAETGVEGVLVVYEKLKNGTERIAWSKTYKLYGREVPEPDLCGIKNDSFIDKFTVIGAGRVYARQKFSRDNYQVTSFTLYLRNAKTGKLDTLKSTGSALTPRMKQKIDSLNVKGNGGVLMFDDIKAKGPNGKEIELPPLRVFLVEEKRLKIGL
jgi:hypothetical protein